MSQKVLMNVALLAIAVIIGTYIYGNYLQEV
jgi:hypothetical protein